MVISGSDPECNVVSMVISGSDPECNVYPYTKLIPKVIRRGQKITHYSTIMECILQLNTTIFPHAELIHIIFKI